MTDFYYTESLDDCKKTNITLDEKEKRAIEKINNARSQDEIVNVISDELASSIMNQIHL